MLFWEKIEYVLKHHHKEQTDKETALRNYYGDDDRKLERGDLFAIILSAFLVLVPAIAAVLLFIVGVTYFFLIH
jgi:hypothetical protein